MKSNEIFQQHRVSQEDDKNVSYSTKSSMWLSKRFLVACLIFVGLINVSLTKLNISIAMVEMTSKKLTVEGNRTIIQPAKFNWDTSRVSLVLNMYEYGGLFSFMFASLPSKIGGSTAYGSFVILTSFATFLIPTSVHLDFRSLLLARFFTGLLDNISYASRSEIFQHWFPAAERSRLMSLSFNGYFVGTTLVQVICGFVAHQWGWPMVFYVTGSYGLAWAILWLALVPNDPSKDRWISKKELAYIIEGTTTKSANAVSTPYKDIFTSTPVWTLCLCRTIQGWAMTAIVTSLPLYVKDATQTTTDLVGYISSIPSAVCIFLIPLVGTMMDCWKNNSSIKNTTMHKIAIGFNFIFGAFLLAAPTFLSNFIFTVTCFTIIRTLVSCNALVLVMVIISMAPNHAGAISALSSFWYALGNISSQFMIGQMTSNHSLDEWNMVFIMTTSFMLLGGVLFIVCGSSEPQSWSKSSVTNSLDGNDEITTTG